MGTQGFIVPFSLLSYVVEIFHNKKLKTKNELFFHERRLGQLFLSLCLRAWRRTRRPGTWAPGEKAQPALALSPCECLLSLARCTEGTGRHRADAILSCPFALFLWFGWV